ncbi:MAG TPA: glycosyltransferase family 39 protein, partial [Kofleriaceae bacterium]|nr:glycosyltransferase family 39 protein [Kofleriaceae bacterium]
GAGQTWDEDVNWSAGRNYITNLLSLDFSEGAWRWNFQHPPIMKYVAGLGAQLADGYGPARALSAMIVAAACALLVPIGRRLRSLPTGVLAGMIAALSPHIIAHGKVVGHEAPTLLWWALGVWLAITAHRPQSEPFIDRQRALIGRMFVIGLVFGLAVFSRFVNALMAPALGCLLLLYAPPDMRKRTVIAGLVIIPVVACVIGYVTWPLLWHGPIDHLIAAWHKLKKPHGGEPFLGPFTDAPSRIYFVVYLVVTAPAGILALAGAGLARRNRTTVALLIWMAAPLLVCLSPVRQDGVRYIMPSLLALAMAAALGLELMATWLARRQSDAVRRRVLAGAGALVAIYLAITCARIHPYYLDYYNELVGGPATVARHRWFEIAWWGEGLSPAIDYLNEHAEAGARVHKRCVAPSHLAWLRTDLWATEASTMRAADWILIYAPATGRCTPPADFQLAFETEVEGAPLAQVYRRVIN